MQSDKYRLIREIAHATNLDFTYVERTLNEIISDEINEHASMSELKQTIKELQKAIKDLELELDMQRANK